MHPITDEEFVDALRGRPEGDRTLATWIGVSIPTITRWRAGKNLPMPGMRPGIIKFLKTKE